LQSTVEVICAKEGVKVKIAEALEYLGVRIKLSL
jgi:hypothetical protein